MFAIPSGDASGTGIKIFTFNLQKSLETTIVTQSVANNLTQDLKVQFYSSIF